MEKKSRDIKTDKSLDFVYRNHLIKVGVKGKKYVGIKSGCRV